MVTDAQGHFKSNAFAAVLSQLPDSEEAKDGDREAELRNVLEACKTQADLPLLIFGFSRHECMPRMMPMRKLQCTLPVQDTRQVLLLPLLVLLLHRQVFEHFQRNAHKEYKQWATWLAKEPSDVPRAFGR